MKLSKSLLIVSALALSASVCSVRASDDDDLVGGGIVGGGQSVMCTFTGCYCNGACVTINWYCTPPAPYNTTPTCTPVRVMDPTNTCAIGYASGCTGGSIVNP